MARLSFEGFEAKEVRIWLMRADVELVFPALCDDADHIYIDENGVVCYDSRNRVLKKYVFEGEPRMISVEWCEG